MADSRSGSLLVLLAAVLWGTTGTAQALAPTGATSISVGTLRLAIGGAALLLVAQRRGVLPSLKQIPRRLTFLAALFIAVYQLCFFAAVDRTGVVIGTLLAIGSAPVITGLLGWVMQGTVPGQRWLGATLLAIAGCTLLILASGDIRLDLTGMLLAIGAGLSYALYTLLSKSLIATLAPDAVMALLFGLGALLLLPLLWVSDLAWLAQSSGVAVALHLGLMATTLAYLLFGRGLKLISPARAVTLSLAEPLTAGLLGVILLGERLTPTSLVGVGLLLLGLLWLASAK